MKIPHLFVAAAAFAFACAQNACTNSSGSDRWSDIELMPIKLGAESKWSMVDHDGTVVYDGEFAKTPSCAVNGFFSVEEGEGYTLYKTGGKSPEAIDGLENLKYIGYVSDGLVPVTKKNSRITIVKPNGEWTFELLPYQNAEIVECARSFSEGMLPFKTEDDKVGYYNTKGEIAINPVHSFADEFNEGLAVVGKKEESDKEIKYSVIDKKGETVFKLKDGVSFETSVFMGGYIVLKEEDRYYLCDKKGEMTKLPSKIKSFTDFNGKFIIFKGDEGYGVCGIDGEIIIRPKYKKLYFNTEDTFFAKKDGDDNETILLDKQGEQIGTPIDYKEIYHSGKFGYIAKEGKTWILLNDEFKPKGKEEFYDLVGGKSLCSSVKTDYFNIPEIAQYMVGMIQGDKVGDITLGTPASEALEGEMAHDYKNKTTTPIDALKKKFYNYSISGAIAFTSNICSSEWNSNSYTYSYFWNPDAKVMDVTIIMKCDKEWGVQGHEALLKALENAGFKIEVKNDDKSTLLKKGKVCVIAVSKPYYAGLIVFDGSLEGLEAELKQNLKALVRQF